jgi:hypothetical protein
MNDRQTQGNSVLDRTAVALSGLCLLHCLALPFIVGFLPFAGQVGNNHFHLQMLLVVVPVSVIALALGFRRHGEVAVLWGGAVGLVLLFAGATVAHDQLGLLADRMVTIGAALTLAVVHFYNSRLSLHLPRQQAAH